MTSAVSDHINIVRPDEIMVTASQWQVEHNVFVNIGTQMKHTMKTLAEVAHLTYILQAM